jgi:hypothetical protein
MAGIISRSCSIEPAISPAHRSDERAADQNNADDESTNRCAHVTSSRTPNPEAEHEP